MTGPAPSEPLVTVWTGGGSATYRVRHTPSGGSIDVPADRVDAAVRAEGLPLTWKYQRRAAVALAAAFAAEILARGARPRADGELYRRLRDGDRTLPRR